MYSSSSSASLIVTIDEEIIAEVCSSWHDFRFFCDFEFFISCRKASFRDPLCLSNFDRRFFLERFKQVLSLLRFVTYSPDFVGITCLQEEVKVWGLLLFSVFDWAQGV